MDKEGNFKKADEVIPFGIGKWLGFYPFPASIFVQNSPNHNVAKMLEKIF
jgi:hypothetical protein